MRKSDVSHFRIFGASVYYHVSKYSRKKLEPPTNRKFEMITIVIINLSFSIPELNMEHTTKFIIFFGLHQNSTQIRGVLTVPQNDHCVKGCKV